MKYKLYNDDCVLLIGQIPSVSLVITDPPYPNGLGYFTEAIPDAINFMRKFAVFCDHWMIFWDEMTNPPLNLPLVAKHIWHRSNTNRPDNYEMIYEFHTDGIKRASRVLSYPVIYPGLTGCKEAIGHPTQKNKKLIMQLIKMSKERGTILDPFFGSNTTGEACADMDIDYIGIEKDIEWFKKGKERIEKSLLQTKMFNERFV